MASPAEGGATVTAYQPISCSLRDSSQILYHCPLFPATFVRNRTNHAACARKRTFAACSRQRGIGRVEWITALSKASVDDREPLQVQQTVVQASGEGSRAIRRRVRAGGPGVRG